MQYSEDLIEEIRIRSDIVGVISGYVRLERRGRHMVGLCPFHNEKTPSFSVDASKQFFYCFGCRKGGNVIHFVMGIEGLGFPDALKRLAEKAGIKLPESVDPKDQETARLKKELVEVNKEAARYFFGNLSGERGLAAVQYLMNRGLSKRIIRSFGLGYATDSFDGLVRAFSQKQVSIKLLEQAGLVQSGNTGVFDMFRNRVVFPIFDIRGNIIAFGGRAINDTQPKYINSPETQLYSKNRELYGLNIARKSPHKYIIVVEGYLDVIALHQAGFTSAVASLGTALTQQQVWTLKKYSEEVILAYDSDEAGQNATLRGLKLLEDANVPVRILYLPEGKDPDEYLRNHDAGKFGQLIAHALSPLSYRIMRQREMHPKDDGKSRAERLNGMVKVLAAHGNAVEREIEMKEIASLDKISYEALTEDVKGLLNKQKEQPGILNSGTKPFMQRPIGTAKRNKYDNAELMLLCILANNNRLYDEVLLKMPVEQFRGAISRQVAQKLYSRLYLRHEAALSDLLSDLEEEEISAIVHVSETKGINDEPDRVLEDLIRNHEKMVLDDEKSLILDKIRNETDDKIRHNLAVELQRVIMRISSD